MTEISIESLEDALQLCEHQGMRMSRQRRYILELLWEVQDHLSAKDIYDRLRQQGKSIGHTSVYQNLEVLAQQGIIECLEQEKGRIYGNINKPHSHVNCLDTGKIIDVFLKLPPELVKEIETQSGVTITHYRIDFYGHQNSLSGES